MHLWWLSQVEVLRGETIRDLVAHANKARSTGSTGVNEESSRSHSIMQVRLRNQSLNGHQHGMRLLPQHHDSESKTI